MIYLVGFLVYAFLCIQVVGMLGWPWWSTAPMALAGLGVLAWFARRRAQRRS